MAMAPASVRELQQSLLWSVAAAACFTGTVEKQQLRIRWNGALRSAYGLSASQSLRGGPLMNTRIDAADRERITQACDALIKTHTPIDVIFRAAIGSNSKSFRVVIQHLQDTDRVIGVLQECVTAPNEYASTISQSRWQSVGRLTLLDEVASAMAHELNQPLAAMATFAQAGERLLNLPEPRLDKAKQVFQEVSQQALRAGELIRHMRGLIKRHAPTKTQLTIAELIQGFSTLAEPMARTHHVELIVAADLPLTAVQVDVTQINQVLLILFQNALDALDDVVDRKSITVTVKDQGDKVFISVTDSGKGIADSTAAQLFQPFFSTKENGTGLGLTSARNILEIYGSRLEFANVPEGGCRFSFTLPSILAM